MCMGPNSESRKVCMISVDLGILIALFRRFPGLRILKLSSARNVFEHSPLYCVLCILVYASSVSSFLLGAVQSLAAS